MLSASTVAAYRVSKQRSSDFWPRLLNSPMLVLDTDFIRRSGFFRTSRERERESVSSSPTLQHRTISKHQSGAAGQQGLCPLLTLCSWVGNTLEQYEVCPPEFSLRFTGVFRLCSDISLRSETGAKVLGWLSLLLHTSYLENENLALKGF